MGIRSRAFIFTVSCLCTTAAWASTNTGTGTAPAPNSRFRADYANQPIRFEANLGQADPAIEYIAHGQNGSLSLTRGEAWLTLHNRSGETGPRLLQMKLAGAKADFKPEGLNRLPGKANYFYGKDSSRWRTDVPTFAQVKYHDVYPGVDLIYYGNQQQLEFDLVVQPGASPNDIVLQFTGADKMTVDGNGDLLLQLAGDYIRQHKPVVYQEFAGVRKMLEGNYVLHSGMQAGFEVADYDKTKPLIIDPVLGYSSVFGGSGLNQALAIALDAQDNVYVTGNTTAGNFPTLGALQTNLLGTQDAFVVKFDTNGAVVYSTYLGGGALGDTTITSGQGIAVDGNGDVFVAGYTSSLTNFPTRNPLQAANASVASPPFNAFVTEINSNGNALVFSTYLGGKGTDAANGIALDTNADVIITGYTTSTNFPTAHAAQPAYGGGGGDAFVAELTADGSALVYSTYLGGSGTENIPSLWTNPNASGGAVAVDFSGNAYVTGWTYSTNFPVSNAFQPTNATAAVGFYSAAFVTKYDPTGNLVYSTYFGGQYGDFGRAIGVDFTGNVYFAGNDAQGSLRTSNALQSAFGGFGAGNELRAGFTVQVGDGFVAALDATGTNLIYSTYLGGSGDDQINGIAVRPEDGAVAVTGFTDSPDFPQLNAVQTGREEGFFTSTNAASAWNVSSTVPGNGIIYEIQTDPSNPLVIYVLAGYNLGPGSSYAGAYKSTDGGNTWTWLSSLGFISAPVSGSSSGSTLASILALDPLNPGTLYVANSGNFYKTTNGGTNWNYVTSLSGAIQSLAIDPVTTTTLYAGTASGGIFKSTNSGANWSAATNGLTLLDIQAVLVDPQNSSNLFAGAGGFFGSKPSLFKSTNGGASWLVSSNGLALLPVAGLAAHSGAFYAILGDTFESASLYRSADGGLNWSQLATNGNLNFTALALAGSAASAPALAITHSGNNDVLSWPTAASGYTLQSSALLNPPSWQKVVQSTTTNNGNIVVTIPMSGAQGYYRLFTSNSAPNSQAAIYLGTDQLGQQGLLKSTDDGATWKSAGFAGNTVNALAVNPTNPATVYAGLNRGRDAFVATLTSAGQLYCSSHIGGNGADQGNAIAIDFENAYVAGTSGSSDFPIVAARPAPGVVQEFKITPDYAKPLDGSSNPPPPVTLSAMDVKFALYQAFVCPQDSSETKSFSVSLISNYGGPLGAYHPVGGSYMVNGSTPAGTSAVASPNDYFTETVLKGNPTPGTTTFSITYTQTDKFGDKCVWTVTYTIIITAG